MMRKTFSVLAAISAVFSMISCNNDLDITADYKEIGVIYGLLNTSEAIHEVRIQKAFLGDGDATVMAQVPDSTYYPDILTVKMERIKNGSVLQTFYLNRTIGPDKEPGAFPTSPNILYQTSEKLFGDSEYKITVTNNETGYEMWSSSPLVDTVKIIKPSVTSSQIINWYGLFPLNIEYAVNSKAEVYNLIIRFKFTEESISTGQITSKYIDWNYATEYVPDPSLISSISYSIDNGDNFYKFVSQKLNPDNTVVRHAGTLDFIVSAGAEVLANYISINSATTSVLTSIPQYTNVNNGLGIFSSRFVTTSPNKPMGGASIDSLKNGQYTYDLGFQ